MAKVLRASLLLNSDKNRFKLFCPFLVMLLDVFDRKIADVLRVMGALVRRYTKLWPLDEVPQRLGPKKVPPVSLQVACLFCLYPT